MKEYSVKKSNNIKWLIGMLVLSIFTSIIFIFYNKKVNEHKVSIIVPVYNVEDYIPKCLDSLINQTYRNIEIICVNDGSQDNSLEVLNKYKKKDKRIKVIDKENGGVSSARNAGLKACKGGYITFVDSDDYIDLDVYEKSVNRMKTENADILFYTCLCEPSGYKVPLEYTTYTDPIYVLENKCENCSVWNKIFKRELIINNNILFAEDVSYGEDSLFLCMVLPHSRRVTTLPEVCYHYVSRSNSIENTYSNEKRLKSAVNRCKHLTKYYVENKYEDSYIWILKVCIGITHGRIKDLNDSVKMKEYSQQVLDILDSSLLPHIEQVPEDVQLCIKELRSYI